jgi:Ferritin-like domain
VHKPSRRRVLATGLAGGVLGLAGGRLVAAGTTPPEDESSASSPPLRPTPSDMVLLQFALSVEMTARDLYQTAIDAGAGDDLITVIRNNHRSYVDILRAILGTSAIDRRDEALYDELSGSFEQPDMAALASTAYDFESTLVATHTEQLRSLQSIDAARRIAAILIVEARHCTVLADAAGAGDDFDLLFVNDTEPLAASRSTEG